MTEPRLGWSEAITLGDLLLRAAERWPDAPALIFPDARWSFRELGARATAVARSLIGWGLRPREHVGVLMPNSFDCLATIFGIALAGGVVVPINGRYRTTELRYIVEAGDLVLVMTSRETADYVDFAALLADSLPGLADAADPLSLALDGVPALRSVVALGGESSAGILGDAAFFPLCDGVDADAFDRRRAGVRLRDVGLLLYTSGTTAAPRGCLLTHEALVRNWTAVGRRLGLEPQDRSWTPIPFFHIGGIGYTIAAFAHGAALVSATHFERATALDEVLESRATVLTPVFPPIMLALIHDPRFAEADLERVRVVVTTGPADTMRYVQAAFPQAVQVTTYGLTETTGVTMFQEPGDPLEIRMTTCGHAQPGVEVRIVDPATNEPLPPGEEGEIVVRGWNVCDGYYRDPERTARMLDADGWLHTKDRGRLDAAGNLTFVDRLDDMLKVGGENVAPAEVEAHLMRHAAVHLAQVVGVPDDVLGTVPVAFVELKPGMEATAEQLERHCVGRIARFKVPRRWRFVQEWPMSATKVQKARLRELAAAAEEAYGQRAV